jgi:hypothetical protein
MYEFINTMPPSYMLIVAVSCLLLGVIVGFFLCAILMMSSRADDEEQLTILRQQGIPVAWRYRIGESMKWIYSEDGDEVNLIPDHWQLQSLSLISNVTSIE